MYQVLDLFSGIGGFSLGLERTGGFKTVAFCEIEEFPRKVLAKHWPDVPIYQDVRELTSEQLRADGIAVDVITGGYPCQPFSVAGKRRGKDDLRHLWPEVSRLIEELRPTWFIGENVFGHVSMGLDEVLSDLEGKDYQARTFIIPACAVGAIHRRDRVWIVAHANRVGNKRFGNELAEPGQCRQGGQIDAADCQHIFSNAHGTRQSRQRWTKQQLGQTQSGHWEVNRLINALQWPTKPAVRGRNDGIPRRLDRDRLKALGNAVVPQIPELIGRAILATA